MTEACSKGCISRVRWLLRLGFRFGLVDTIQTLKADRVDILKHLDEIGKLNLSNKFESKSIFDLASSYGAMASLRWLAEQVSFRIPSSAVNVAASYGKLEALSFLIECGAYWDYENIVRISCELDRPDMHEYIFDLACEQADALYKNKNQ
jgi:hypothetical protein